MVAIFVHPTDPRADVYSISEALELARAGDVVLVGPGHYSPLRTDEIFPLRVPAGVAVEGAGADLCTLDGEEWSEPSFNPVHLDVALVVLGDRASLTGLTVTNGGGFGVGIPAGVSASVRGCTISGHGGHGLMITGAAETIIQDCQFFQNGRLRFSPALLRSSSPPRQGHHIFAEAYHGRPNRLIVTGNTLRSCYADGIAVACFYAQPDGVEFDAKITNNTIEDSERGGILFSCSFGPSGNRQRIAVRGNTLRGNHHYGIRMVTGSPHSEKVPRENETTALISDNDISASPIGIFVMVGGGEAERNRCRLTIDRNRISEWSDAGLRLVAGLGQTGLTTAGNQLDATVARNELRGPAPAMLIEAAAGPADSELRENLASVHLIANQVEAEAIDVRHGPTSNRVETRST